MTGTAQYWRYVCKLAWRDTRGELAKAIARFAAIAMILGLAIFVGAAATGVDRLFVAAAIPLAAHFSFGATLIVIPARLHHLQGAREDAKAVALNLERLYAEGQLLRTDSTAGSVRWFDPRMLEWEQQVVAVLKHTALEPAVLPWNCHTHRRDAAKTLLIEGKRWRLDLSGPAWAALSRLLEGIETGVLAVG